MQLVEDIHASVPRSKRRILWFRSPIILQYCYNSAPQAREKNRQKLKDFRFSDLGEGGWGGGGVPPDKKKLSLVNRFEKKLVPYEQ